MKKKIALSLSCLVVLGLYGCSDEDSGAKQEETSKCTFESAYCDGQVLHLCSDGVETTETCSGTCNSDEGKCEVAETEHDCGEEKYFDEEKGECVPVEDSTVPSCDPGKHYDAGLDECVDDPEVPSCDPGKHYDEELKECVDDPEIPSCDPGKHYDEELKECVDDPEVPSCEPGKHYDEALKECVNDPGSENCALGLHLDEESGKCIEVCKCGFVYDKEQSKCVESDLFSGMTEYEKHQLALRETAMAFYRKGDNIQYESHRRSHYVSPETASSQHMEFLVCSGFVYAVFYQALGIELPDGTNKYNAYGKGFSSTNDDIIYFTDGDNFAGKIASDNSKKKFLEELLKLIKLGDAISYYGYIKDKDGKVTTDAGHVTFAYDFVKDDKGNITDVVILHSTSNFEPYAQRTTKLGSYGSKLSRSLSWRAKKNEETGVAEGTVQKTLLSSLITGFSTKNKSEFVVLRPIKKDDTYKHVVFSGYKSADYPNWKDSADISDEPYAIKDATLCRMQYHDIEIEKTLDVHPGSTVEPGESLTYTIEIINHSDKAYKDLYITEDLSEFVDLKEANGGVAYSNAVAWFVPSIDAGAKHTITYTVEVKNNPELVGEKVISTGSVAQINSKTIENTIAYNLSEEEIKSLKLAYKLIAEGGKVKGIEAIEKTYKEALDYDLPLKDLKLGALYIKGEPNTVFKTYPDQIPYYDKNNQKYDESKNTALLVSLYANSYTDFFLNPKHALAGMILNHYYSGGYMSFAVDSNKKVYATSAYPKTYEYSVNKPDSRTDRENMIYPETLRDGDILIYANTMDDITKENGLYAYIFLDGKFKGANSSANAPAELSVKDGTVPEFYKTHEKGEQKSMIERFGDMPKMFGKDFYVILRPALTMKKPATDSKP